MQLGRGYRVNPARACIAADGRRQHQPAPHASVTPVKRSTERHAPALPHWSWIDGGLRDGPEGLSVQCPGKPSRGSRTTSATSTQLSRIAKERKVRAGKIRAPPAPFSRGTVVIAAITMMSWFRKPRRAAGRRAARIIWDPNNVCCRQSGCRQRHRAGVLRGIDWV